MEGVKKSCVSKRVRGNLTEGKEFSEDSITVLMKEESLVLNWANPQVS